MSKFIIYCEIAFLEELYDKIEQPLADLLSQSQNIHNISSLYELIHEHSDLLIDLDGDEFINRATNKTHEYFNPNLKKLFKDGQINAIPDPRTFKQMDSDGNFFTTINFPQALFFLSKTPNECKKLCEDYGYIFISKDEIDDKIPFLFNFDIQNIIRNQQPKSWEFLKNYQHPFNAMVIADNYILNRRYDENLFAVLRNLMPETLNNQPFHLTIIVKDDSVVSDGQRKSINNFLDNEFDYEINLTILKTSNIHDRNILTNYIWISSAYGFELFNNRNVLENRQTQVKMFPITYLKSDFKSFFDVNTQSDLKNTIFETVEYLRNQSKGINKNTVDILEITNVYGDKVNRLLE
jgi:hypothetical protein